MQELASLLPIIGIALLFWLLIIRPQSKRQKAVQSMQAGLQPGTEVMLTSGIFVHRATDAVSLAAIWVTGYIMPAGVRSTLTFRNAGLSL